MRDRRYEHNVWSTLVRYFVSQSSVCSTSGVLRGDNARFQLFGDTMNTASRVESTGEQNKTQLSKATADLLIKAGKSHWIERRLDAVYAKGKGELETYWLTIQASGGGSTKSGSDDDTTEGESTTAFDFDASTRSDDPVTKTDTWEKDRRIVDWNVAVLEGRLKAVVAKRRNKDVASIVLDQQVILELHQFVLGIAFMYNKNPFHNFLHASHVTMAVTKMLSRVVTEDGSSSSYAKGITDDPLTQFAVVFGALVHDGKSRRTGTGRMVVRFELCV
jgi:Adenylate and Guanylate cyclase catalytic domain